MNKSINGGVIVEIINNLILKKEIMLLKINVNSRKVLDIRGFNYEDCTPIDQYELHRCKNQVFDFLSS